MLNAPEPEQAGPAGFAESDLLLALQRGVVLLTPHARAARFWAARYDAHLLRSGAGSWPAAAILPWEAWTASLWNAAVVGGADTRVPLNRLQEDALWCRVLGKAPVDALSPASFSTLCADALAALGRYDVAGRFADGRYGGEGLSPDAATFARWYADFETVCLAEGYLPQSHVEVELAAQLRRGTLPAGGEYLLCGFPALTPAQQAVLAALRDTGATVGTVEPAVERTDAPWLLRCESPRQELQQCAAWVRDQLRAKPSPSLAVVVPDLPAARAELERELRAAAAPAASDVTSPEPAVPYEFSSGRTLQQLPMVADALLLLRWCAGDLSIDDAGAVLRSRHLALAGSPEAGAALEASVLRRLPFLRRALSLAQAAKALDRDECAPRLRHLERDAEACRRAPQGYAWFAGRAAALLQDAGWPDSAALNSDEFQAVDRWNEALDQVSTLDLLGGTVSFQGFVTELEALAGTLRFAPENRGLPVQVITPHEAMGTTADALWFLHADSDSWPSRPRPNPLLPQQLQRDLRMPGTDPGRDEADAEAALQALLRSCGSACFSYCGTAAEGAREPSPSIVRLVGQHGGRTEDAVTGLETAGPPPLLREQDPEPLPPLQNAHIAGGVSVLTAQAQCGFQAFAEKRLFARPVEELDAGLSPGERGDLVHGVLQRFWETVRTQQRLKELTILPAPGGESERDALLRSCTDESLRQPAFSSWDAAYLEVQRRRLFKLLSDWLASELDRPPFEVIAIEKKIEDVPVGPLRLDMRVDRVDRVIDGAKTGIILIDYKTGALAKYQDWLGERPEQPQLPTYAVAGAEAAGIGQVNGLAFGLVKVGKDGMKFDGLADDFTLLRLRPRGKLEFPEHVAAWDKDMRRLAEAFAEGDAAVKPKIYPKTCDRCAQRMLCRVDAATLLQLDDPEQDTDEEEVFTW